MKNPKNRGMMVDTVYNKINDDIRKRYFNPGQKLILRELSERYGISHTPIQQALNRLIADRVVDNVPRFGTYVRRISWKEIEEAMQARLMVEEYSIPSAVVETERPEFMRKLEEIITGQTELQRRALEEDVFPRYIALDMQFHKVFINSCRNSSIMDYYDSLTSPIYLNYVYRLKKRQRLLDSCREHQEIFAALKLGKAAAVRTAIKRHNHNTAEDYRQIMLQEESPSAPDAMPEL